jgi:hypothetical protein
MLIYKRCCLCAEVASRSVEIASSDTVLAKGAFECDPAVRRFSRVISHAFIVVLLPTWSPGNRCGTLEEMQFVLPPQKGELLNRILK